MITTENTSRFIQELTAYVGQDYLSAKGLTIGLDTRFDQLNFDIVDEIIVERIVNAVFDIDEFKLNDWPITVGELLSMVNVYNA
jgi:hypothetical protein